MDLPTEMVDRGTRRIKSQLIFYSLRQTLSIYLLLLVLNSKLFIDCVVILPRLTSMDEELTFIRIELTGKLLTVLEQRNYLLAKGQEISLEEKYKLNQLSTAIQDLHEKIDTVKSLMLRHQA